MNNSNHNGNLNVLQTLEEEPFRFNFFQAVRMLDWSTRNDETSVSTKQPIGRDAVPKKETVRIKAHQSLSFPSGLVADFEQPEKEELPAEMVVPFFGITGPNGALPRHYTQLVIDRSRDKDFALRDFLDLFNHRAISFFYRAWAKYRLPIAYEEHFLHLDGAMATEDDLITRCLRCLTGFGTKHLTQRQELPDNALLYYGGHLAHQPRNAQSLARMVEDYFGVPASVIQLVGQWLYLSDEDQSKLGAMQIGMSLNNQLGKDVVVGNRVWGIENSIRIQLGPVGYDDFKSYSPAGDRLQSMAEMIRTYVGMEFDFDVQVVLRKEEVPQCQLGGAEKDGARLGWNTWVRNNPMPKDADDAIFACEGLPAA